jgi:putative transposase
VNANQAGVPVRTMCRVFKVSASGYYAWCDRAPSRRAIDNAVLTERIRSVHAESDATYDIPRVRAELIDQGVVVSHRRVARLMRAAHLRGVSRRRVFVVTTRRDKDKQPAPDLVKCKFKADAANRLWVADMTYVPTWAGFIYLAIVLDVWSRRIVGWAIGEQMTSELVLGALNMALQQRKPEGVIHHSDQGSQYTSIAFGERCQKMGVRPSMGTVGVAYDNAMAESFFATLECELIDRRSWPTKTEARLALFTYIEGWYNPRRRHSALGQMSPANFERKQIDNHRMPAPRGAHGLPTGGACVAGATPPVDIHGRPQFARLSHVAGEQEKIADIHPAFRRSTRFGPDGMRWLAPQQLCELEARYPRQVRPAPVLPVLPSTINCQSNLCRDSFLFSCIRSTSCATPLVSARARARRPCPRTAVPTPAARSCWPSRRRRRCGAGA